MIWIRRLMPQSSDGWRQLWVCLVLIFVNSATVISLRVSQTHSKEDGEKYIIATAIITAEIIKICVSAALYCREYLAGSPETVSGRTKSDAGLPPDALGEDEVSNRTLASYPSFLFQKLFVEWKDTIQLAVPGGIYFLQNNLLVFALSKLDSVTFQISYQLKIMTTAMFTVLVLRRSISTSKWISLSILMMGVVLVQYPAGSDSKTIDNSAQDVDGRKDHWSTALGLGAVLAACVSSGFAGVYFEKMLNGVKSSLWLRNIQLALFGITLGLPSTLVKHWSELQSHPRGFFQGYTHYVWIAIFFQACSGIAVALVIKYAGNVVKCLASAVAIIVSTLVSYYALDDITLTPQFVIGGVVVLASVFLYNLSWQCPWEAPANAPNTTEKATLLPVREGKRKARDTKRQYAIRDAKGAV